MPNTYRKVYPGVRSGGFEVVTAEGELNLVVNAYYDEASGNWYRIDESKACWRMWLKSGDFVRFYHASSGTGAISWTEKFALHSNTILYTTRISRIRWYSQDTEPDVPVDEVALWEDTANNRYWLIWDKDGTQRKVELT